MNRIKAVLISVFSVVITAVLGALFTSSNSDSVWYTQVLNTPSFLPPSIVFPIAWNILFILMIISFYFILINKEKDKEYLRKISIYLFSVQLMFNIVWSLLFFELRILFLASLEILILEALIIFTIIYFYRVKKLSAYLLIPYALWVLFASILTVTIYFIN